MRSRTDQRRRAIIREATAIFHEHGYERSSMTRIAARVGGSKATLYGYFGSKEELFAAVMTEEMASQKQALLAMLDHAGEDPRAALLEFGRAYLELVLSPQIIAATRSGVSGSDNDALRAEIWKQGPGNGWNLIAGILQGWVDRGLLRAVPPKTLAYHLRGLLEAGTTEPVLYGAPPEFELEDAIERAIDAFLRAYAAV